MNQDSNLHTTDSTVDARAALALILIVVVTALVWVSQQ
jgi:hypothetical protein